MTGIVQDICLLLGPTNSEPLIKNGASCMAVKLHCVIAGVYKSGTSSLYRYLADHPAIIPSKIKETAYFLKASSYEQYLAMFGDGKKNHCMMEASPGYFSSEQALQNMKAALPPESLVIIVLRSPTERFMSFYSYYQNNYRLLPGVAQYDIHSPEDFFNLCSHHQTPQDPVLSQLFDGLYHEQIIKWHKAFGKKLLIIFFDDLKQKPLPTMSKICEALGIDGSFYQHYKFDVHNQTISYKFKLLQQIAVLFNKKFEYLLRKYPKAKDFLRSIYYACNQSSDVKKNNVLSSKQIDDFYSTYNLQLHH